LWGPWLAANYGMQREDVLKNRLTLSGIVAMWDALKEAS